MIKYEKPVLNVVELQIKESITSLVPKNMYKTPISGKSVDEGSKGVTADSEIDLLESYATSNQTT